MKKFAQRSDGLPLIPPPKFPSPLGDGLGVGGGLYNSSFFLASGRYFKIQTSSFVIKNDMFIPCKRNIYAP